MRKKVLIGTLMSSLLVGGVVSAGKVIDQYKTPRGNIATVEQETIHKNRIGITVNGKPIQSNTWYHDKEKTYVKLRDVSEMLGAKVNYNEKTMSADITLPQGTTTQDLNNMKIYSELYKMHDDIEWLSSQLYHVLDRFYLALNEFSDNGDVDSLDSLISDMESYIKYYNDSLLPNYSKLLDRSKSTTVISSSDKDQVLKELNASYNIMKNYLEGMYASLNYIQNGNRSDLDKGIDLLTTAFKDSSSLNDNILDVKNNVYNRIQEYPNGVSKASISSNEVPNEVQSPKKFNEIKLHKIPKFEGNSLERANKLTDVLKGYK